MTKKIVGLVFLLLVLVGGIAAVWWTTTNISVPAEHQTIIDNLVIVDTTKGYALPAAKCVASGTLQYGVAQSVLSQDFTVGESYAQTTWVWQRSGDTNFVMKIWGPDNQGGYDVEFGRLCTDAFTISFNGKLMMTVPVIPSMANSVMQNGYFIVYVAAQ